VKPAAAGSDKAAVDAALAKAAALARSGRPRAAIEMLERDRAASRHPVGCNALGTLLSQSGSAEPALGWFDKAVALAPSFVDAHNNRGVALQQLGRLPEALAAFRRALDIAPGHLNALMNSGNVLQLLGHDTEALQVFDRILAAKPDLAEAALKRAYVHMARKEHTDSLHDFETVLRLQPGHGGAAFGRVSALISLRRFEEALTVIDAMLATRPGDGNARVARGQVLIELDRAAEALALAEDLLARGQGGSKAEIIKAAALWRLGRHAEAMTVASDAGRRHPTDVQINQALSQYYLGTGDFAHGWDAYEFRAGTFDAKQAPLEKLAPRWAGEDVAGKTVLVFSEQGIGDTIQFARFLIDLSSRGARVKALVQPTLLSLVRSLPVAVEWFDQAGAVGGFDYQIPLLSLPRVFGTRLESIPARVPYLTPAPEKVADWRAAIGDHGFRVGVIWQGNPRYAQDHRRSVPLRHYAALAAAPGVRLISLQAMHGLDQIDHLPEGMTVETLGDKITANPDGVAEIAAAMAAVDLIVSSDTAMAHLAGALGRPVWVALSDEPDWRWLFERDDSPWYPTMRLFRQTTRGDWQGVFATMATTLKEKVGQS
jgi:tetratricopeptide (TPR) repeat protein